MNLHEWMKRKINQPKSRNLHVSYRNRTEILQTHTQYSHDFEDQRPQTTFNEDAHAFFTFFKCVSEFDNVCVCAKKILSLCIFKFTLFLLYTIRKYKKLKQSKNIFYYTTYVHKYSITFVSLKNINSDFCCCLFIDILSAL